MPARPKPARSDGDVRAKDPGEGADPQAIAMRLRLQCLCVFQYFGLAVVPIYVCDTALRDAWGSAISFSITLSCVVVSFGLRRSKYDLRWANLMFLSGMYVAFVGQPIFDADIASRGLWMAGLVPMAASCISDFRATLWSTVAVLLGIFGHLGLRLFAQLESEIHYENWEIAVMMALNIIMHTLVAYMISMHLGERLRYAQQQRKELDRTYAQAKRADDAKSRFLAKMSHEIRTPMNGLLGMTQYLQQCELDNEDRETLETVHRCGENLLGLLNDILDQSNVATGHRDLEAKAFDLAKVLQDTRTLFLAQARLVDIEVVVDVDQSPCWRLGDEKRLRQVISNLTGNAIKFSNGGRVCLRLQSDIPSACSPTQITRIEVSDEGIGMTLEQCAKIFDQFEQVDDAEARRRGGTGLGLSISAQLIEQMGGSLGVESEVGKGSIFSIELALATAIPLEERFRPRNLGDARGDAAPLACPWVLIVDDNAINRKVAELAVSRLGCRFESAENGVQGVEKANRRSFDIILMDMRMPVLDGIAATRMILQNPGPNQDTPIVALTANAYEKDRRACQDAGMVEHIAKPFQISTLREMFIRFIPGYKFGDDSGQNEHLGSMASTGGR